MNQFKAKVLRKLYCFIPRHMKRLVLWVSVVSAYRKSTKVDNSCVKALNDLLGLASKESAMSLPITISKVIWKDVDGVVQVLHDASSQDPSLHKAQLRERFIQAIPAWLCYSTEIKMGEDFEKLVQNRSLVMMA